MSVWYEGWGAGAHMRYVGVHTEMPLIITGNQVCLDDWHVWLTITSRRRNSAVSLQEGLAPALSCASLASLACFPFNDKNGLSPSRRWRHGTRRRQCPLVSSRLLWTQVLSTRMLPHRHDCPSSEGLVSTRTPSWNEVVHTDRSLRETEGSRNKNHLYFY